MLLSCRLTRLLFEAVEDAGIRREDLVAPLGLSAARLSDAREKVDWATFMALHDELSRMVGHYVERLRDIGRRMIHAPSYAPMQRAARTALSLRTLYEVAERWIAPANLPHVVLLQKFVTNQRLRVHGAIPEPYASSPAFMHIFEGNVVTVPCLLGLPPGVIVESRVTSRTLDAVVDLPRSTSVVGSFARVVRRLSGDAVAVLEDQRQVLAQNIEELQRARDELRTLLDRLPDLVVIHVAGEIVWVNRATVASLGYADGGELVGRQLLDVVAPQSRELVGGRIAVATDEPLVAKRTETWLVSRTGERVLVEASATQSVTFEGAPARLIVARDVTERARMQEGLLAADRLASIGLLAAGVAHEVNNPLAYVLNNIEIARKDISTLGPGAERSLEALAVALEGVDRIRTIVRELLMLSRGEGDSPTPTDVRAVTESTLVLAEHAIQRTARLVRELDPVPLARASQPRIAQVLLNLLANALEAMRSKRREESELKVRVAPAPDGRVMLEISDTGSGIATSDMGRIFEPFFTTKPAGHGTGLGLAITQRLVVELGGEITVASVPGRGTTFRVLLPAAGPT